ncbi:MAG: 50S ribosomal protein L10 [Elusimicrobiota bacterium]|jgi:large subunit ribosomal protein L10|nr:50S ribosomal protein L10 [Elusimicrobiota bacterium]
MPSLKNQESLKVLTEKFKTMKGMILTEYHGLSVGDVSEIRAKLHSHKSEYVIVKNTLSELALKEIGIEAGNNFIGPTAIAFLNDDIAAPAKTLVDFMKTHEKLKIKSAFLDGKFVDENTVKQLSSLPSREVLIAQMLGSLNAPISGFVNVLAANIRALVTVLDAVNKKQSAA